jgi:hypothetical protein
MNTPLKQGVNETNSPSAQKVRCARSNIRHFLCHLTGPFADLLGDRTNLNTMETMESSDANLVT